VQRRPAPGSGRSIAVPAVRHHMEEPGKELGWHGALSADVILCPAGPVFIDINSRLVEPVNALRSGVDLVASLLEVARSAPQEPQPAASAGVSTHQLLLAVLGAAQHGGRRDILGELLTACLHPGAYRNSTEELTPLRHDPRSGVLLAVAAAATVIRPRAWKWFASGSVAAYALTPAGWGQIADRARQWHALRKSLSRNIPNGSRVLFPSIGAGRCRGRPGTCPHGHPHPRWRHTARSPGAKRPAVVDGRAGPALRVERRRK
jgi:hypothetical protein